MTTLEQTLHDLILRNNFEAFLRRCLMTLNPGQPYLPNWHVSAIAYQLDRVRRGEVTRLIINMPPRHLKSLAVSVAFPAFLLGHEPWHRIFVISYSGELSSKQPATSVPLSKRLGTAGRSTTCGLREVWKTRCRPPPAGSARRHRSMER